MKKEKLLFDLPSLTSLEGKTISLNSLQDLEDEFETCSTGCKGGCGTGKNTNHSE